MKIWHDDIRKPPEGWTWARTNDEAKALLLANDVEEISLDHDLGMHKVDPDTPNAELYAGSSEDDGMKLVQWMCEHKKLPPKITIHSWNTGGAQRMAWALRDAGCNPIVEPYQLRAENVDPDIFRRAMKA